MLFDLRGRGRRRTIQAIYLLLAILMGGGLVFFGIGGNTSGGLLDAFKGGGGSSSNGFDSRVKAAEQQATRTPNNPAVWAQLAAFSYLAGQSRKGDRASAKAVSPAPSAQRSSLKQQLDQAKKQGTSGASAANQPTG